MPQSTSVAPPVSPRHEASRPARLTARSLRSASGRDRRAVLEHLFRARVEDGYVGNFAIDRDGDTTRTTMGVYRVEGGRLRFKTAITPPAELLPGG